MTLVLKRKSLLLLILLVTVIILLSFRNYSAYFTTSLNSDQAVHVLMSYDLRLPEDLYFWGQNRLGSIVPILTHGLLKIVPLHPALAVALVHYCFLILGYFAFTSLFQNLILKIIFALIWFLPLRPFNELVVISQPYGPQLALIGVAIALTQWLLNHTEAISVIKRRCVLVAIIASWMLSVWISDFSIIMALIFIGVILFPRRHQLIARSSLPLWQRLGLSIGDSFAIGLTAISGAIFIGFAKAFAPSKAAEYGAFSSFSQIQSVVNKLLSSFAATIGFHYSVALGVHALLAIGVVLFSAYLLFRKKQTGEVATSRWTILFLLTAIISMVVLVLLEWVYKNGVNLRYFTVVYISCWLAALLFANSLSGNSAKQMTTLLLVLSIASTLTLNANAFAFQRPASKLAKLAPLESLGAVGFIGDYWTSYVICTVNPSLLNCTPYDKKGSIPCQKNPQLQEEVGHVRCRRCVPKVLASETIYLVKQKWLDEFPQEIQQFKTCLVKAGEPRKLGGYTIAPYKKRAEPTS